MQLTNQQLAYQATRIAIGISIFFHGAVRIPKLSFFAHSHLEMFSHTFIGGTPTLIMCYIIPFLEASTGLLILIGGKITRYGLTLGIATMGILMFGASLAEKFDLLISMLLHVIIFFLLLTHKETYQPAIKKA
jgi:thiosulfate dehydrogenase [quinone] large subunit